MTSEIFKYEREYSRLESSMVHYKDLAGITVNEDGSTLVPLDPERIPFGYIPEMADMESILGGKIFVRRAVNEMLQQAQTNLQSAMSSASLFITYGYRSLEIQTQRFLQLLKDVELPYFENPIDLYEEIHRYVAVPSVAGHPTGGAVDIIIKDTATGESLDFGSRQYDFNTKDSYTFSPFVTQKSRQNRIVLRQVMLAAGFAPFDGEWWHFSYGDKEWAFYYKKPNALYEQKKLSL